MARIRTLKPEFWPDEKLSRMPALTRLVFLGLISQADDAGRLVDNVKLIDGLLFPETDESCRDALAELAAADRILRYLSESGQRLIQIINWDKHQKVAHPSAYVLPAPSVAPTPPDDDARSSRESHESLTKTSCSDPRPTTNDLLPTTVTEPGSFEPAADAAPDVPEAGFDPYELIEPGPDEARPSNVIALRSSDPVPSFAVLDADEPVNGGQIMAAWIAWKRPSLSKHDRGRMAAAAQRPADGRTMGEVRLAMIGMDCIWPYAPPSLVKGSEGRAWDLMNLEKDFIKAMAGAGNHPVIRKAREDAEWETAFTEDVA